VSHLVMVHHCGLSLSLSVLFIRTANSEGLNISFLSYLCAALKFWIEKARKWFKIRKTAVSTITLSSCHQQISTRTPWSVALYISVAAEIYALPVGIQLVLFSDTCVGRAVVL